MKKYFLVIISITLLSCPALHADEFSQALANFMLAEKDLLALYRQSDPKDRPTLKTQLLRAGITPEQIDSEITAIKKAPVIPSAPLVTQDKNTGDIDQNDLQQALKNLKKTSPNAPKTFDPLPGKPREQELKERKANLKKTGLLDT